MQQKIHDGVEANPCNEAVLQRSFAFMDIHIAAVMQNYMKWWWGELLLGWLTKQFVNTLVCD